MNHDPNSWYAAHESDYESVHERLTLVRNIVLHGREECAIDILRKSCVNAVFSIQTGRERHERAFTMYYGGDRSLSTAAGETVYGNQKADWLGQSLYGFGFSRLLSVLREEGPTEALPYLVEHFKGLSWVKAGFALAMSGIWELACPDTRVSQMLGIEDRVRTESQYYEACQRMDESIEVDIPLFMKQWCLYDAFAGEHATHDPYFIEVIPAYYE